LCIVWGDQLSYKSKCDAIIGARRAGPVARELQSIGEPQEPASRGVGHEGV